MARNINGGTDHIYYTIPGIPVATGCFAFWMKTTQATANAVPASYISGLTRNGFIFVLNNTLNKILVQGYDPSAARVALVSTTSVNDGNPHLVVFNFNRANGGANALFIDGTSEATGNSSASWTVVSSDFFMQLGDQVDTFWPSYIGDVWEVGYWNANLTADEIAALAKGFSPKTIRQSALIDYWPLVRGSNGIKGIIPNDELGTTVVPHGRIMGGSV